MVQVQLPLNVSAEWSEENRVGLFNMKKNTIFSPIFLPTSYLSCNQVKSLANSIKNFSVWLQRGFLSEAAEYVELWEASVA